MKLTAPQGFIEPTTTTNALWGMPWQFGFDKQSLVWSILTIHEEHAVVAFYSRQKKKNENSSRSDQHITAQQVRPILIRLFSEYTFHFHLTSFVYLPMYWNYRPWQSWRNLFDCDRCKLPTAAVSASMHWLFTFNHNLIIHSGLDRDLLLYFILNTPTAFFKQYFNLTLIFYLTRS